MFFTNIMKIKTFIYSNLKLPIYVFYLALIFINVQEFFYLNELRAIVSNHGLLSN